MANDITGTGTASYADGIRLEISDYLSLDGTSCGSGCTKSVMISMAALGG